MAFLSYLGRGAEWGAEKWECDQVGDASGRVPIVIHLGDFLQLKPTGGKAFLISRFEEPVAAGIDLAPECHAVMELFCNAPRCFERQAPSRFEGPKLWDL
eukprot:6085403-Pyramimonas_sp.AAC.1